jgi:hypothetical protein
VSRRRAAWRRGLCGCGGFAVVLCSFLACSSSDGDERGGPDSGADGTSVEDAGVDARQRADSAREGGNCSPVKGSCDLVVQDCPDDSKGQKQECVVARASTGDITTECVPVQASQQLPIGRGCCPGSDNPCLPGLSCVGDPCVDGGPTTARCTPACCDGDHASCGQSDPEGIGGQCDLTLFVDSTEVHHVCSYRERCKPFGVEPCKQGQLCIVEDKIGTAGCIASNNVQNRQRCQFANDCADGYICVGGADAGVCRMFCLTPNSNPPFDASAATGEPGRGGCPAGEECRGPTFENLPDWLQLCELPDGG